LHFERFNFIIYVMNEALLKTIVPRLGTILRIYREKLNKNQGDIAKDADISISMLSQIERGKVSASIDTLMRVCGALDINIVDLFRRLPSSRPVHVHRTGERLRTGRAGIVYEQLVSSADANFPAEMFLLEVEPGRQVGLSGKGHDGIEMGYVLEGKATLSVGEEILEIKGGDSISFSSHVPHRLTNDQHAPFMAIWSVMPPHKDYLDLSE